MAMINTISKSAIRLFSSRSHTFLNQNLWTPDNVVKSPYKDIEVPTITITEHIWKNIDKWADKTALICGVTDRSYTYHQLYKQSRTFAANLRKKLKIRDGDMVCVMMPNSPEFGVVTLGILEAGAEMTPVNHIYTAHEVQRQLALTKAKLVIGTVDTHRVIKEALKLNKIELPIVIVKLPGETLPEGTISLQELAEDEHADLNILKEIKRKSEDLAILPCSSGTTGLSKGVELTHKNIVVNMAQQDVNGAKFYKDTTGSHQDSAIAVIPFYHIYGLSIILLHKLSVGVRIVTLPKFQPDTFLSIMKEKQVSMFFAAPPIVLFVGSHPNVKKEHLESVECILSGAAPLANRDIHLALDKMKSTVNFMQLYGSTETAPLATCMFPGYPNINSVGFPVSNTEVKVVDSELKTLGPNEIGELLIRGPQIMKGYKNNPEATKESITEDGWYRSGDLAFLDKDGAATIADRLKELIKVKGYQVPPAELESVLKEHPAILDAGVIGIPDPRTGEAPKAFIVLKQGEKENRKDIQEFVKERVAEYKRIKEIVFLDSLPKSPSGKLLRRVLKEEYS